MRSATDLAAPRIPVQLHAAPASLGRYNLYENVKRRALISDIPTNYSSHDRPIYDK